MGLDLAIGKLGDSQPELRVFEEYKKLRPYYPLSEELVYLCEKATIEQLDLMDPRVRQMVLAHRIAKLTGSYIMHRLVQEAARELGYQ